MKPTVFIGSSTESVKYANCIKDELDDKLDITIWNDNFFEPGNVTYDVLYKKSICFKYAVFIGGKDDIVFRPSKQEEKIKPRDNVYYEMGLYAGILSPRRTFFFADREVQLASDFMGVTCFMFSNEQEVRENCQILLEKIMKEEENSELTLLPTVPGAVAYFNGFVRPACQKLQQDKKVQIGEKLFDIDPKKSELKIVFPEDLSVNWKDHAEIYYREHGYSRVDIDASYRTLDVQAEKEQIIKNGVFRGCMSVDAMQIVYQVIHEILNAGIAAPKSDEMTARKKEACVFYTTLKNLVLSDEYTRNMVKIVEPDWMRD